MYDNSNIYSIAIAWCFQKAAPFTTFQATAKAEKAM